MEQKAKALPWLGWRSSGGAGSEGFSLEVLSRSCPGCCPSCKVTSVLRCPLTATPLPGLPPGSPSVTGSPWRGQRRVPSLGHLRPQPGPRSRAQPQLPKAFCVPRRNISCRDSTWRLIETVTSASGTTSVSIPGSPRTQFQRFNPPSLNPEQEQRGRRIFETEQGDSASTGELGPCPAHTLVPDPSPGRLRRFPSVPVGLRRWQFPGWDVPCGAGRAQVTVVLQQEQTGLVKWSSLR